jgi:hypothetical protein
LNVVTWNKSGDGDFSSSPGYPSLSADAAAVIAFRKPTGSRNTIAVFDIVALGTLRFVVINLAIIRTLGMPRSFFRHRYAFCEMTYSVPAVESVNKS